MKEKVDSFLNPDPLGGQPAAEAADPILPSGCELGHYAIVQYIAEGGMGVVYLSRHKVLQSQHAIKVIRSAFGRDPEFVSRFRREARIMAALDHPAIVRVTDYGEESGHYFYVMDYVSGPGGEPRTLQDELDEAAEAGKPGLPERDVKEIAVQICDALAYAHGHEKGGVAHLDLKPSNIMLTSHTASKGGRTSVKVTDFGFAKILGRDSMLESITKSQVMKGQEKAMVGGTPRYMSPEQWKGETEAGPASDIYALGVILYEALVGKVPQEVYPSRPPSYYGVSIDWNNIIRKCLRDNPQKRYRSVSRLATDIRGVRFDQPAQRGSRRRFRTVLNLSLLVAAAAFIAEYGVTNERGAALGRRWGKEIYTRCRLLTTPYLKPAGYLNVQSNPDVLLSAVSDSGRQTRLGMTDDHGRKIAVSLPEGVYDLVFSSPGYYPVTERIEIAREKVLVVERQLDPILDDGAPPPQAPGKTQRYWLGEEGPPGRARILSNVSGASVYQGARRLGAVGDEIFLPPFQAHTLEIRAPGYKPTKLKLTLQAAGQQLEEFAVRLEPAAAQLLVVCGTPGAEIYRNSRLVGKPGEPIPLDLGESYVFEVRAPGCRTEKIEVKPQSPGESIDRAVTLSKAGPVLHVTATVPYGYRNRPRAEVFVDGRSMGVQALPADCEGLEAGRRQVSLGGHPWKTTAAQAVDLGTGGLAKAHFTLDVVDSYLEFDVAPESAVIYVAGQRISSRRVAVKAETPIEVRVWAKDHEAFEDRFTVDLGLTNRIAVNLQKKGREGKWDR